jgi:hypothetical protein
VFLDVAKTFDTIWAKGVLCKLTVLNFPSYLVKTISSYPACRTFQNVLPCQPLSHVLCGLGWPRMYSSLCAAQSVCNRHAYTLPLLRPSAVRRRHGPHRHVRQTRCAALQAAHQPYSALRLSDPDVRCPHQPTFVSCKFYNPSFFALRVTHLSRLVIGKHTSILGFRVSSAISEP